MGTPHGGSQAAFLGSICANILSVATLGRSTNTTLIKELKEGSPTLRGISRDFPFLGTNFPLYTFVESDGMNWLSGPVSLSG
jgi:hypothetical protein